MDDFYVYVKQKRPSLATELENYISYNFLRNNVANLGNARALTNEEYLIDTYWGNQYVPRTKQYPIEYLKQKYKHDIDLFNTVSDAGIQILAIEGKIYIDEVKILVKYIKALPGHHFHKRIQLDEVTIDYVKMPTKLTMLLKKSDPIFTAFEPDGCYFRLRCEYYHNKNFKGKIHETEKEIICHYGAFEKIQPIFEKRHLKHIFANKQLTIKQKKALFDSTL